MFGTSPTPAPGQRRGLKEVEIVSAELVLFLIFLFFSGVWAAIKFVDEHTDNKWVFLVPAAAMSLFLFSGNGEGGAFYACLFAFGPIIVMLVKVGLEQGKQSAAGRPSHRYSPRKPLDLNRKLAPSDMGAYDRLITSVLGGAVESREEGIRILNEFGIASPERFFSSPYVIKALGLEEELSKEPKTVGDDWWEEGYSADEGVESDAGPKTVVEMEPSPTPSTKEKGSEDTCGEAGCSTAVNAFDFRCFTCRKRYCQAHGGKGVDCQECSDK
jgi:hypothetical protein